MTFEKWLLEQGFKHPEFDLMIKRSEYALMKAAWNAAINSSIRSVGSVSGDNTEELHALKKLLTS